MRYTAPRNDSAVPMKIVLFTIGLRVINMLNITSITANNVPVRDREKQACALGKRSANYKVQWSKKETFRPGTGPKLFSYQCGVIFFCTTDGFWKYTVSLKKTQYNNLLP